MTIKEFVFASLLLVYLINDNFVDGQINGTSKRFFLANDRANFFLAYINCKQSGMNLATIISKNEEDDLAYFLRDVTKDGQAPDGFWLSGTNLPDVGSTQYYWLTGGQRAIYTNWLPGEPSNTDGHENCLQWVYSGNSKILGWNDYTCQTKTRYICQY